MVLKIQTLTNEIVLLERKATATAMIVTTNHHINQPLTVLKGHVELLQVFGKDQFTDKSNKHFDAIHTSIKRIQEIISQMEEIENIEFTSYADGISMIDIEKK